MAAPRQEARLSCSLSFARLARDAGAGVLLVFLASLFFWRFVFAGYAPYWEDLLLYFYPISHLAAGAQARPFVFWNPYVFSGVPLAANPQTFTFYPPRVLFYFLPLDRAMVYLLVGHVAAAGVFMYALCRRCGSPAAPAFFGGVVFMLSSYVVSHIPHVTMTLAVPWTPLVLLSTQLVVREERLCPALWGGVASGMQILAGHVQTWYLTVLVCVCYGAGLVISDSRRTDLRRWVRFGALLVTLVSVSLAVSSVQLLPMVDVVRRLERPADAYGFATLYSLGSGFIRLLVPHYFGAPQTNDYWGGWNYWELAGYVGVMPLLLAIVGMVASRRSERYVLAGIAALGLALAMGSASPAYFLAFKTIPFLSTFRAPARFLLWFTLAVAMLSSFGLQALLERGKPSKLGYFILTAGAGFLVALCGLWRLTAQFHVMFVSLGLADKFAHLAGLGPSEILNGLVAGAQRSTEFAALWTVASVAILGLYFLPRLPRGLVLTATFMLLVADLACAGVSYNPVVRPDTMLKPPRTLTQLVHTPDSRIYVTEAYLKSLAHQYLDYSGFGPSREYVQHVTASLSPNVNILYGVQSIDGYDPLRDDTYRPILAAVRSQLRTIGTSPLLDFLGARYVLSDRPLRHFQLRPAASDGDLQVYENPQAFPKFTIVPAYRVIQNSEDAYRLLTLGTIDLRHTVLVNREPFPGREAPAGPVDPTVVVQEYSPDRVRVSTTIDRPAVLVMNDVLYPGWRAMVDGTPVDILRANGAFRAVPLLRGHHTVWFVYRPPRLELGAGISVLALLLTVGLTVPRAWRAALLRAHGHWRNGTASRRRAL